ncbi:hypothetical protein ANN_21398 [Periplaneta americana]|uniref:PiggyBac transposable element-derived protein domain-containing protein n=1 Tax=Periplaneta americana TaxID=6978 RepID=A0ABQ8SFA0_PERAM|nr:hypothetical protein ANN_21398 [Periplaneta americana]
MCEVPLKPDEEILNMMVTYINQYAAKKNRVGDCSENEMMMFLAVVLLSGYVVVVPKRRMYWQGEQDSHNELVSKAISRDRFDFIMMKQVGRFSREKKLRIAVPQPRLFESYNNHMGGIDRGDQNVSLYRTSIRGKKWYFPIIAHLIDVAEQNACLLYRPNEENIDNLSLQRRVATAILKSNKRDSHQQRFQSERYRLTDRVLGGDGGNRLGDNAGEMYQESSTESYPAFAHNWVEENPGRNLNQVTCPDRDSNLGHLVSRSYAPTVTPHNIIRFADDIALLAEKKTLRDMLVELNGSCEQYEMKINANKTKTMVVGGKLKKQINASSHPTWNFRTWFRERHMPLAGQRQIQMERSLTPVSERVRVGEG